MTQATSNPAPSTPCDLLVIGGGPGGSTIAALAAAQGRSVVLVEKERHPRFHIGESLLPANVRLFDQLGVRAQIERIGMPKWGVEFVSQQHRHRSFFSFGDAWDKSAPMSWQVRRSEFDEILFRHAAARGARTHEGCRVEGVEFDADGAEVAALDDDGTPRRWRARYVVDASGRDTLLARQFGDKRRHPRHASAAIFGHYTGARRLEGERLEGNISLFWFAHGWFWFIPLADGTTSVGATCTPGYLKSRAKPLAEFFADTVAQAPALAERLRGATLVGDRVWATGNYAYVTRRVAGARWLRLGDAYAFIDPVFSSGVYLAMANAFAGVDLVAATLDRPREAAAARRRYIAHVRRGPRVFSWFIYRMTNPAMRDLFMSPRNVLRAQEAVLSVLAGDIYGGSPIGPSVLFFKFAYYVGAIRRARASWDVWRARRRNLAASGPIEGENVQGSA
ncbi:MAG: tryptophan 7-halogenase [Burkholderiales bacterium]|nr:tryptophan 7-halogenase [Burkholderiales bacterium]MDE2504842.1 tryptophan 7-halogenase [Burkholderiales bacterium]